MIRGAELSVCIAHHRGHLFKGDRGGGGGGGGEVPPK